MTTCPLPCSRSNKRAPSPASVDHRNDGKIHFSAAVASGHDSAPDESPSRNLLKCSSASSAALLWSSRSNVQHQQRGGVERVEVERLCARRQLHGVTAEDENTEAVSVEVDEKNEIWKGGS